MEKLSKERPLSSIFNLYVVGSILIQFAIHVVAFLYLTDLCDQFEPFVHHPLQIAQINSFSTNRRGIMAVDLEAKFSPNLLNTCIYLISLSQQVSTFAINFQGRPFREGITENSALYYGLMGVAGVAFCGATDFIPSFNSWLQLVPMDNGVSSSLLPTPLIPLLSPLSLLSSLPPSPSLSASSLQFHLLDSSEVLTNRFDSSD